VHLPFLQAVLGEFRLVPIVAGDARADEVAAALDLAWGGPETVIVVSTDLSHYLDYASCRAMDAATVAAIERLDSSALAGEAACGRVGVGGLLLAASRRGMSIATLDVRNSGDTAGPKDRVVGYGSWALWEQESGASVNGLGPALLALARAAIGHGLAAGQPAAPTALRPSLANWPFEFGRPGAVFVTLKRDGALRGCIGSPVAWRALAEDAADNAFKAAFQDPRFPPLTRAEWEEGVDVSVSLLTPPEPMSFAGEAGLLAQLRPRVDGLIIEDQGRRALFLPSVWEQLPDPHQFLAHLKLKAGLGAGHWSPGFRASRFQAIEMKE
jgi:AmmeMemoRadiSam system protein A